MGETPLRITVSPANKRIYATAALLAAVKSGVSNRRSDLTRIASSINMKTIIKQIAISVPLITVLNAGFAQSTFGFVNYLPSVGINAPVFNADGSRLSGADFVAVLYGGP